MTGVETQLPTYLGEENKLVGTSKDIVLAIGNDYYWNTA